MTDPLFKKIHGYVSIMIIIIIIVIIKILILIKRILLNNNYNKNNKAADSTIVNLSLWPQQIIYNRT